MVSTRAASYAAPRRQRRAFLLRVLPAALILLLSRSAAAYDALLGWSPVEGAAGYTLVIQYDDQPESAPVDLGLPIVEVDGLHRVVITDLPVGPVAAFSAHAYDDLGQVSVPSEALAITYAEVAAVIDEDGDGLTNAQEDVDLDRVVDANETDPNAADSDGDDLSDGDEVRIHGTDPLRVDSDGDGYGDGDEIAAGSDPNDANSVPGVAECTAASATRDCDDGNPCTDDDCAEGRCVRTNNALSCNDGADCTSGDRCDGGACRGIPICDAGWVCNLTANRCVPASDDFDNDGLLDPDDPCPDDVRNRCFGLIAVDDVTATPIRINANTSSAECAGDKTDCAGDRWFADFGYSIAGRAAICDLDGGGESCQIAGIAPLFGCLDETTEDLFQCEHADYNPSPELYYTFSLPNGRYLVNLFFANTDTGTENTGDRLFDIVVEDELAYSRFDQVEAAGGSGVAVVRSAVTVVEDGELQVLFVNLRESNPAVKALEVLRSYDDEPSTTTTTASPLPVPTSTTTTLPGISVVCVEAGSPNTLAGDMTTGTAFTNDDDRDGDVDNLTSPLLFSNSTANDFVGNNGDHATYDVVVPNDGTWYLWGRFYYPGAPGSNDPNSFYAKFDDNALQPFGNKLDQFQNWHWDGNGAIESGAVSGIPLGSPSPGSHTITVHRRETAARIQPRLDVICISKDANVPPGEAQVCTLVDCTTTSSTVPDPTATTTTTTSSSTSTTQTTTTLLDRSTDSDNDGLADFEDACPIDASNACFGTVVTDGLTGRPLRINANPETAFCSGGIIDCRGEEWQDDFGYVDPGKGWACSGDGRWGRCDIAAVERTVGCESPETRDVFRCAHSVAGDGETLAYVFRVPPGDYLVNLYFANVRWNESDRGSQLTDISINGVTAYERFDEIAAANGSSTVVVRSSYTTVSTNGDLVIELASVVGRASINALEVLRAATRSSIP